MKNIIKICTLTAVVALGVVSFAHAQANVAFTQDLTIGSTGSEVVALQQQLVAKGYLVMPAGTAYGYFGNLTKVALANWQAANGISPALGYFGPLSRAAISTSVAQNNAGPAATISNVSVRNTPTGTGAVALAGSKTVTWQTSNFPTGSRVDINLLKKTSDSPATYTLLRTVVRSTVNDGVEIWVPQAGETSANVYVEVVCSNSSQFKYGCTSASQPMRVE